MKNLKLGVKLLGGFLITAAITVAVGTLAYYQLASLAHKSEEIATGDLPGVQAALIDMDRERFYLPAYMHRHGWIGMRLDLEPVDWAHLEQLLTEAYLASAPRKMAREWEASRMAT